MLFRKEYQRGGTRKADALLLNKKPFSSKFRLNSSHWNLGPQMRVDLFILLMEDPMSITACSCRRQWPSNWIIWLQKRHPPREDFHKSILCVPGLPFSLSVPVSSPLTAPQKESRYIYKLCLKEDNKKDGFGYILVPFHSELRTCVSQGRITCQRGEKM